MIREYVEKDLFIIDKIYQRSMLSIIPPFYIVIISTILMFCLHWYILFLPIIVYLCFYIYIKWIIWKMLPSKNIEKYKSTKSTKSKILILTHETNNDQIIGFTSICPHIYNKSCWITYMFIDPPYQKKGYGLKLCEAIYKYAVEEMQYKIICGGTSSIQISQLKLHRKYARSKENSVKYTQEFIKKNIFPYLPIYEITIIYTLY